MFLYGFLLPAILALVLGLMFGGMSTTWQIKTLVVAGLAFVYAICVQRTAVMIPSQVASAASIVMFFVIAALSATLLSNHLHRKTV